MEAFPDRWPECIGAPQPATPTLLLAVPPSPIHVGPASLGLNKEEFRLPKPSR